MQIQIQNAIFDDLYITSDVSTNYITTEPTEWDDDTLLWAKFDGNLIGGNLDDAVREILEQIDAIRIKKRTVGEFEWTTIAEYKVGNLNEINFKFNDVTGANGVMYEYAWIPVLKNGSEGQYITNQILSEFNNIVVGDQNTVFVFRAEVEYGTVTHVQKVGAFEPYGRRYPIVVTNAETNYEQGGFSARLLGTTYSLTNIFRQNMQTAKEIVAEKQSLMRFLTNKRAKILKDPQGNIWLIFVNDVPSITYDGNVANTMLKASFNWTEIGDATNTQDLVHTGLVGGKI